jgi:PST family polysaccharide transporter
MYRLSSTTVHGLIRLVTAIFIPVLFSSLARLKDDDVAFLKMYSKFQKMLSFLLFPIGVGVFLYKDLATSAFFGQGWEQISIVVGLFSLIAAMKVPINDTASVVYFSKGKPIFSIISQVVYLICIVLICFITPQYGFGVFVFFRGLAPISLIISSLIILRFVFGYKIGNIVLNILPALSASAAMFIVGFLLQKLFIGLWWDIIVIIICALFYFCVCFILFRSDAKMLLRFLFKKKN